MERNRKLTTNVNFDLRLLERLDRFTEENRPEFRSRSEVIRAAVEEYLKGRGYE